MSSPPIPAVAADDSDDVDPPELLDIAQLAAEQPDVRAPSEEEWALLTPEEREQVIESLPIEVVHNFMVEGDTHAAVVLDLRDMLEAKFRAPGGRGLYLGLSVIVYYPKARNFAPDLFAVLDVSEHRRDSWVVSHERRGLDVAFEVHWKGSQKKDMVDNVRRYAGHGIPEYFVLDRRRMRIHGFRLPPGGTAYVPILPQGGRFECQALGVWLGVEADRFRFYDGQAALPNRDETIARLDHAMRMAEDSVSEQAARAEAEAARANAEAARAESEAARAESEAARARSEAARANAAESALLALRRELELLRQS